jgi:hypothetical protein
MRAGMAVADAALLELVDQLVSSAGDSVTVRLTPRLRTSLRRLKGILADRGLDSLLPAA